MGRRQARGHPAVAACVVCHDERKPCRLAPESCRDSTEQDAFVSPYLARGATPPDDGRINAPRRLARQAQADTLQQRDRKGGNMARTKRIFVVESAATETVELRLTSEHGMAHITLDRKELAEWGDAKATDPPMIGVLVRGFAEALGEIVDAANTDAAETDG